MATVLLSPVGAAKADLVAAVVAVKPSVVLVGTYSATESPRFGFRGSGFVVGAGNMVVTNAHVLPEELPNEISARKVAIQVWSSTTTVSNAWSLRLARVLALDVAHDLVLLGFEGPPVSALPLARQPSKEGTQVAFMGFPIGGVLGFSHVTHRGIISSIAPMALPAVSSQALNSRAVAELRRGTFNIYQLDATAYPGNSGGPVFDSETGEVLGVINSVLVKGSRESALTHPSGISYAIPIEHVLKLFGGLP
jgi:S1-C subfamily serine protease